MNRLSTSLRIARSALALSLTLFGSYGVASADTISAQARLSRQAARFQRLGLLRKGVPLLAAPVQPAKSASPRQARLTTSANATSTVPLAFVFDGETFNSTELKVLSDFLRLHRGDFDRVYGPAAPFQNGKTVTIVGNLDRVGYAPPLDPASTSGGTIQYKYDSKGTALYNKYNFARTVLAAYHGRGVMSKDFIEGKTIDPWETAFQDAAALAVTFQASGSPANFDPGYLAPYFLPVYDTLNRPGLGSVFFGYREGLGFAFVRGAMAQAAWLKAYIEDPEFFKKFNAAYYQAFQADSTVAADEMRLRQIAAGVLPTVEGRSFNDWFRRQYALDTEIRPGKKLYLGLIPYSNFVGSGNDTRSQFEGFVQYSNITPDGTDVPIDGTGTLSAVDENGVEIKSKSAELSNNPQFTLGGAKYDPGSSQFTIGFSGVGTPDRARLNIFAQVAEQRASAIFPYNVSGTVNDSSVYYGAVDGTLSGTASVAIQGGNAQSATVQRGVWRVALAYPSRARVRTSITFNGKTHWRNTAWFVPDVDVRSTVFVIDALGGTTNFTLTVPNGASKWRMVSLPLYPTRPEETGILGIAANLLKLGRYRSNLYNQAPGLNPQAFGIDPTRHELYPYISAPMGPGRGYWLKTDAGFGRNVQGTEPPRGIPFNLPLRGGFIPNNPNDPSAGFTGTGDWNQIGIPFNKEIPHRALKVQYGNETPITWDEAVAQGWVSPGIWRWKPAGGYMRVDNNGEKLRPFLGYYVFAAKPSGLSLIVDANATASAAPGANGWSLNLTAATSTARDTSNLFGVSTNRVPAAKPPGGPQVVTLRFLNSGSPDADASGAGSASGWADSFLPALGETGEWNFVVDGAKTGEVVTLSWGSLTNVPADLKLRIQDVKPGTTQRMLEENSYSFTYKGIPRAFKILARRVPTPSISVVKAPSTGYTVRVNANMAFTGVLDIKADGAVTRVLKTGSFPAGISTFNWDGKNAAAQSAPAGTYRAWITPDDVTGTAAKAVFNVP